jgi:hypothetical protein
MVLLVWDDDTMYYLMSSRAPDLADNGAISLLLWQGMQRANQMQLTFDLDGVTSAGTWQFLNGFGGHLSTRFVVSRSTRRYAFYRTVRDTIKKAYARA